MLVLVVLLTSATTTPFCEIQLINESQKYARSLKSINNHVQNVEAFFLIRLCCTNVAHQSRVN